MTSAQSEANSDNTSSKNYRFDSVVVFGQGPVKPVLLEEEVTSQQAAKWQEYRTDPYTHEEPDFWLIQQPKYLQQLEKIKQEEKITEEEKLKLIEFKRQEWQRMGWFAMKTMGRQNALAAGYALYKGITKRIIFTGGQTVSPWAKDILPKERLGAWPSEAALMKDIVLHHYGDLYEKKYGKIIDDVLLIEDAATNTLENISFVLNKYPELLESETRIGYLSARHHLRRIKLLTRVFSLECEEQQQLIAAQELVKQAQTTVVDVEKITTPHVDEENYLDAKTQCDREERWRRGLKEPEYVSYWLGYIADVKYPSLIQKTLKRLCEEAWCLYTKDALAKVGIDFNQIKDVDLCVMKQEQPEKYMAFIASLKKLKAPEHRRFPAQLALAR